MDLNTVSEIVRPALRADIPAFREGDAFLAGGTWLFSEPQSTLRRLIDLPSLAWPPLHIDADGLHIAATCTLSQLEHFAPPAEWLGAHVIAQGCRALLGSFKIARQATVGGNLCLALPAAPIAAVAAAFGGICTIWGANLSCRRLAARDLILGDRKTGLQPGEILRSVLLPSSFLRRRAVLRQQSLTPLGRSAALLIATQALQGVELTITAATPYPVVVMLDRSSSPTQIAQNVDNAVPAWLDDVHGAPHWRRRITHMLATDAIQAMADI